MKSWGLATLGAGAFASSGALGLLIFTPSVALGRCAARHLPQTVRIRLPEETLLSGGDLGKYPRVM
jgi:hypothetical protein